MLVVSAAAGSTGSVAAQLGRLMGCRVVGIAGGAEPAFSNMMRVIYGSIRVQGFLFGDYRPDIATALDALIRWTTTGEIVTRQDVRKGFDDLPVHFNALFDGWQRRHAPRREDDDAYASS